jgi:hypothetical protein
MIQFVKPDSPILAEQALVYEFWSFYCCNRDILYLFLTSCLKCLRLFLENHLSIGFLYENRTLRFGKLEGPVFSEDFYIHPLDLNLQPYLSYLVSTVS